MSEPAFPMDVLTQLMGGALPETVEDMRRILDRFAAMFNADAPKVGAFHEKVPVEGRPPEVTADVIVPEGEGPWPVLVYLHGGGWICGSPATHRKLAHRFAQAGHLVFNVDYRLAPEHPFPTPLEDCVASIRWAARVARQYGGDPARLAVGGDSAGGNLSAASAIVLRDDPTVRISAALLIYGLFDFGAVPDLDAMPVLPGATPELLQAGERLFDLMRDSYLGRDAGAKLADPRVSPIHAAHRLPPSHILCGTADPLLAQAKTLAEALDKSGVEHELALVENMPHGFAQMEFFAQARASIDRMAAFLARHLPREA